MNIIITGLYQERLKAALLYFGHLGTKKSPNRDVTVIPQCKKGNIRCVVTRAIRVTTVTPE